MELQYKLQSNRVNKAWGHSREHQLFLEIMKIHDNEYATKIVPRHTYNS